MDSPLPAFHLQSKANSSANGFISLTRCPLFRELTFSTAPPANPFNHNSGSLPNLSLDDWVSGQGLKEKKS